MTNFLCGLIPCVLCVFVCVCVCEHRFVCACARVRVLCVMCVCCVVLFDPLFVLCVVAQCEAHRATHAANYCVQLTLTDHQPGALTLGTKHRVARLEIIGRLHTQGGKIRNNRQTTHRGWQD